MGDAERGSFEATRARASFDEGCIEVTGQIDFRGRVQAQGRQARILHEGMSLLLRRSTGHASYREQSSFAFMEAAIILAAVGRRYRFTLDPDAVIGIKPQITLLPANGIPATLERR